MKHLLSLCLVLCAAIAPFARSQDAERARFLPIDVWLDVGVSSLAAWQIELRDPSGRATIVGVEGGEHPAYAAPAHYDPRALAGGRIVLAAFSTAEELPRGRTRVARVHLRVVGGEPDMIHELVAVADENARPLQHARLTLER